MIVMVIFVLASWPLAMALGHVAQSPRPTDAPPAENQTIGEVGHVAHSPRPTDAPPAENQTIGEREPVVAVAAAVGIILTGVAGIYIYRIIRKGL